MGPQHLPVEEEGHEGIAENQREGHSQAGQPKGPAGSGGGRCGWFGCCYR